MCARGHRYAATNGRTCKPFNPLLGETFEYVDTQRKFRFLAEKVVHHPTVLAAHVEGMGWTADADLEVKSKFWGRCIELKPVAYIQVRVNALKKTSGNRLHSLSAISTLLAPAFPSALVLMLMHFPSHLAMSNPR